LNLILIALHNLATFPLAVGNTQHERGTLRMRCVRAHPNLALIDTIGLNYETEVERNLLEKIIRGVVPHIPQPVLLERPMSAEVGPDLIQLIADSLIVDLEQYVHQVIWVINPMFGEEPNHDTGYFEFSDAHLSHINMREVFQRVGGLVATQLPPMVVFTHADECRIAPQALRAALPWHEPSRKCVLANYPELPGHENVPRLYDREEAALRLLVELLVQCEPSLARFLQQ
jgi:hypothetical protein